MTEKQIEYILAIEKFRSISKAAESLKISQPYLSQFLSNIESDIGYKLFDRSAYPITITPYGEAYVQTAKEINNLEIDLKNRLNELNNSFTGTISLAIPSHVSFGIMPTVLRDFHVNYPKYKINVLTDTVQDYAEAVKTGTVDIAITAKELEDASIGAISTKAAMLLIAAPASYDIADDSADNSKTPYPLADISKLAKMPFIQMRSEGGLIGEIIQGIMKGHLDEDTTVIECDSYFLCTELIREGLGASIIPSTCINPDEEPDNIKYYCVPFRADPKDINVYYRKKAYISKPLEDFINLIIQALHKTL